MKKESKKKWLIVEIDNVGIKFWLNCGEISIYEKWFIIESI